MLKKIIGRNELCFIVVMIVNFLSFSQGKSGKIVFERKTNLEKKMGDIKEPWVEGFLATNKIKKEYFELYFSDSTAIFKPVVSDEEDESSWATSKNTVLQNFKKNERLIVFDLWQQEEFFITGQNSTYNWKITNSKRKIGNYECQKAIWQKNDSTRLYAWFTNEILASVGPEGFNGLPGAILGIATEDGGVIYFAKSVELLSVKDEVFKLNIKKKNLLTLDEFIEKIEKQLGDDPWGKNLVLDLFRWM